MLHVFSLLLHLDFYFRVNIFHCNPPPPTCILHNPLQKRVGGKGLNVEDQLLYTEFPKDLKQVSDFPFDLGINDASGKSAILNIPVSLICIFPHLSKRIEEKLKKVGSKLHRAQCLVSLHQLPGHVEGWGKILGSFWSVYPAGFLVLFFKHVIHISFPCIYFLIDCYVALPTRSEHLQAGCSRNS